jgi:heptosyltransferase II
MRALIIETAFIGDVIVSLGLAPEIKRLHPDAFVAYLVRPESQQVVRACPDVDNVIVFDKYGSESGRSGIAKKADELNQLGFDTIFALHSSKRTQALVSKLNAATKAGFVGNALTHRVEDNGWNSRYERAILPLRAIEPVADLSTLPRLDCGVHPEAQEFASCFDHVVALAPGSVWATKQWGEDKFAALAKLLSEEGIGVIVIGDKAARTSADVIISSVGEENVLDLTGRATLVESGAAIAASSLLVSNDSAPAHIGVAVGTPVITIFGPTVPEFGFAPPEGKGDAIEIKELWCRPCASHGGNVCPTYTHDCMKLISAERVFERVLARVGAIRRATALS